MDKNVQEFMRKLRKMPDFDRVKFVILFGSQASGKANKMSDYDFAVYYEGNNKERFKFQIAMSRDKKYDVKIFQDSPLFIRKAALGGKVIYARNLDFVYDIAYETIRAFEDFKKGYYDYIGLERIK